ncbi:sensor histidine kinase [Sphingomonas tabacisoli]|uniref:histidine kinase n=1 Tax=Sphingomonas tabacisoli TaxID=2249466 RepID=A0ABW4I4Z6_9SPHN
MSDRASARDVPTQAIALVLFVFVNFYFIRVVALLPRLNALVMGSLTIAFAAVWAAVLFWRLLSTAADRARMVAQDTAIFWTGTALSSLFFWLAMPFATEDQRMLAVFFTAATVAHTTLVTIRPIDAGPFRRATLLGLPVSTVVYFLVHRDEYSVPVILFSLANLYSFLVLRGVAQRSLGRERDARREAEQARDARTRFLAAASHDLQQPLQAARLFFAQTMRAPDEPRRQAAIGHLDRAFDAMEQLLTGTLDHLRLERQEIVPSIEPVSAAGLIARVVERSEPAARLDGIDLRASPAGFRLMADPALAERALENLVANAIRHSGGRRVLVGARRRGERVRLWVVDDGRGIPEGDRSMLFDEFVQGSDHGDHIRGGFGLGLASVRRMAKLMGGEAGLDPKWEKGSAFWLELPAA